MAIEKTILRDFYKNKRVLITGHTGFKGSWLAIWLNEMGAEVFGLAIPPITQPNNFRLTQLDSRINSNFIDIRNYKKFESYLKQIKPEIVFHLAAQSLVRRSYIEPKLTYETNLLGIVNLLEIARVIPQIKTILVITSDKAYENFETKRGYKELDRLGGKDPYSASKAAAEIVVSSYYRSFFTELGVGVATARAGNVIGGGDWSEDRIIPDCVRSILNNKPLKIRFPDSVRPWQYVLEPLSGYLWLVYNLHHNPAKFSSPYNFGPLNNSCYSVKEIIERFFTEFGKTPRIILERKHTVYESGILKLNISKAKNELQWSPTWNFGKSVRKTAQWYKQVLDNKDAYELCCEQIDEYIQDARKKLIPWAIR
ncbi:MAG: CDP-glucose 4,6-dehydratase [Ignavibacteria bacterium]